MIQPVSSVRVDDILAVVGEHFQLSRAEMKSERRTHPIPHARAMAAYLIAKLIGIGNGRIGIVLGGRDATTILAAIRRARAAIAENGDVRDLAVGLETSALAIGRLRETGAIRAAPLIDPVDLARRVIAGDERLLTRVSTEQIKALCEELMAARIEPREEEEAPRETDETPATFVNGKGWCEPQNAALEIATPVVSVLLDTPIPVPPTRAEIIHDFLGAEAVFRRSPCLNVKFTRAAAIEQMRLYPDPATRAVIDAYDQLARDEYTSAEKGSQARYRAAVSALAKYYAKPMETAHGREAQKV